MSDRIKEFLQSGDDLVIDTNLITMIINLLQEVRDEQIALSDSLKIMEGNAITFEETLREHAKQSKERHLHIISAFPAGDIDGHRRYHESLIEWRELRNKVIRECLIQVAKAGLIGAFGWMFWTLLVATKFEIKRWIG
jgi:hypothetical protein